MLSNGELLTAFVKPAIFAFLACSIAGLVAIIKSYMKSNVASSKRGAAKNLVRPPDGPTQAEFTAAAKNRTLSEMQLEWPKKYGKIFTMKSNGLFTPDIIATGDVDVVKELVIKQCNMYRHPSKFSTRMPFFARGVRSAVGSSVTGMIGEPWKWRKEALVKEFHRNRMMDQDRKLLERIIQAGAELCNEFDMAAENKQMVKVDVLTTRAAVEVILFFLFGRNVDFDAERIRNAAEDIMFYLARTQKDPLFGIKSYLPFFFQSDWDTRRKKIAAWAVFDCVVSQEIEALIQEANGQQPVALDRSPGSVIESLLRNEPRFRTGGAKSIIAEVRVFVLAGFETTAHALAFAFGMLAEEPLLANEVSSEAQRALTLASNEDGSLDTASFRYALESSELVKNFFLEAVRLYPLAPMLTGYCTEDIAVKAGNAEYGLSKGQIVLFFNMALQRSEGHCGVGDIHPDEIAPNRWNGRSSEHPFLNTFNNGPHKCPGKPLSLLEGHIFLMMVASRFTFSFAEDRRIDGDGIHRRKKVEYTEDMLLRPKNAMPLMVKKIKGP